MNPLPTNSNIFKVKNPNGQIWDIPEENLDKVISLGGKVIDDAPEMQSSLEHPQEKIFKVKNPNGQIWDIPESNLQKVQELGGQVVGEEENRSATQPPQANEYTGENRTASFAKNAVAGFVGGIPDIGISAYNAVGDQNKNIPYVTDIISNAIDNATGGYTKDTDPYTKHAARFLSGLFGGGAYGKGIQALGATGALGKASSAVEKAGKIIKNHLGVTEASTKNVAAGLAGGAAIGASEQAGLPAYAEIPAVILGYILGGMAGGGAASLTKKNILPSLKPLFEKVPGLEKFIEKQNYKDIASLVDPNAISDMIKSSLIDKEAAFLTEKTLSKLPEEIQVKLKENPALLNEQEASLVAQEGMKDFTSYIDQIEKEYGINSTLGEYTGSPKVVAKEDALANKPNIDTFDIATKNRKRDIVRNLENTKDKTSKQNVSAQELGEVISDEVDTVYRSAEQTRTKNWNEKFGNAVDEPIIPIPNYTKKLKEFAALRPDNEGNKVAVKTATQKLKDGIGFEQKISPKRINDILVGQIEDLQRFPDKTFSKKRMGELKSALESDLDEAMKNSLTKDQAQIVREARLKWKEDSQIIDEIDKSDLFSKVNAGNISIPEKVASTLDRMPKSQLELTFKALERSENHQNVIPQIQKYYISRAVESATKGGSDNFNPRAFIESLPKKEEFDVIFRGTDAYREIKDISVLLKRMVKYQPVRGNSKTAQRAQADRGDLEEGLEAASNIAKGKWLDVLKNMFSGKGNAFDETVAEIMLSPEKRKEVLKYVGKKEKTYPKTAATFHTTFASLR